MLFQKRLSMTEAEKQTIHTHLSLVLAPGQFLDVSTYGHVDLETGAGSLNQIPRLE
jgi:hypothetical protein